jgi:hypothetical protein
MCRFLFMKFSKFTVILVIPLPLPRSWGGGAQYMEINCILTLGRYLHRGVENVENRILKEQNREKQS